MSLSPNGAVDLIEKLIIANIKIPVCLVGGKGIGKSCIPRQVAKRLSFACLDIRLSLDSPEDIGGWPRPHEDHVKYLITDWFKEAEEAVKKFRGVILFFDEPNRSHADTRQALFELMTEFSIRRRKLPENSFLVFAMNPDNGEYQVDPLDIAFERRMIMVAIEPSVESWTEWAREMDTIKPEVYNFIAKNPAFLFTKEKFDINKKYDPSAWHMVSEVLRANLTNTELVNVLTGLVGKEATAVYLKFSKDKVHPLTAEEFFLMSHFDIEDYVKNILKENSDRAVLIKVIENVVDYINKYFDKYEAIKDSEIISFLNFAKTIPPEHAVAAMSRISVRVFEYVKKSKNPRIIVLRRELGKYADQTNET